MKTGSKVRKVRTTRARAIACENGPRNKSQQEEVGVWGEEMERSTTLKGLLRRLPC
jgi:hypothetical protein